VKENAMPDLPDEERCTEIFRFVAERLRCVLEVGHAGKHRFRVSSRTPFEIDDPRVADPPKFEHDPAAPGSIYVGVDRDLNLEFKK
jgi:hypothetical protein